MNNKDKNYIKIMFVQKNNILLFNSHYFLDVYASGDIFKKIYYICEKYFIYPIKKIYFLKLEKYKKRYVYYFAIDVGDNNVLTQKYNTLRWQNYFFAPKSTNLLMFYSTRPELMEKYLFWLIQNAEMKNLHIFYDKIAKNSRKKFRVFNKNKKESIKTVSE